MPLSLFYSVVGTTRDRFYVCLADQRIGRGSLAVDGRRDGPSRNAVGFQESPSVLAVGSGPNVSRGPWLPRNFWKCSGSSAADRDRLETSDRRPPRSGPRRRGRGDRARHRGGSRPANSRGLSMKSLGSAGHRPRDLASISSRPPARERSRRICVPCRGSPSLRPISTAPASGPLRAS